MKEESPKQSPKPATPKSPICNKNTVRKLRKEARIANYIYQVIMILIGGAMFCLTQLDRNGIEISETVFKVFSIITSVFLVVWTNLLNLFKRSVNENDTEQK